MSLMMTGEQWDFPNCWSPLQGMLIQGLHATGDSGAQRLALELARRWLVANHKGFSEHQQMFEKVIYRDSIRVLSSAALGPCPPPPTCMCRF